MSGFKSVMMKNNLLGRFRFVRLYYLSIFVVTNYYVSLYYFIAQSLMNFKRKLLFGSRDSLRRYTSTGVLVQTPVIVLSESLRSCYYNFFFHKYLERGFFHK